MADPKKAYKQGFTDGVKRAEEVQKSGALDQAIRDIVSGPNYRGDPESPESYRAGYEAGKRHGSR